MLIEAKVETQEKTLARMLDWVKAADTKAQFTVALDLAIIGAITSIQADKAKILLLPLGLGQIPILWRGICCILPVLSLVCCLLVAIPRVRRLKKQPIPKHKKHTKGAKPSPSLLFFGTVAQLSSLEHKKLVEDMTDETYLDDLIDQIHINAGIAHHKFRLVKYGMRILALSVIPWTFFAYFLYK